MSSLESIKVTFFQECEDLLSELESGLITLKNREDEPGTIDAIFRAVHSIKGGAGAFDLTELVNFSHTFENVLDDMRSDTLESSENLLNTLLESSDMLHDLVYAARDDITWDSQKSADLLIRLKTISSKDSVSDSDKDDSHDLEEDFGFQPMALALDLPQLSNAGTSDTPGFSISFKPHSDMFKNGHSVTRILTHLKELGDLETTCVLTDLPPFTDMHAEDTYLAWEIKLTSSASEDEVKEVFEFVIDDCDLIIRPSEQSNAATANPLDAFLSPPIGEGMPLPSLELPTLGPPTMELPSNGAPTMPMESESPSVEKKPSEQKPPPLTQSAEKTPSPSKIKSGKTPAKAPAVKKAPPATIRINLERVDRLINQVGELVINQAMLTQCVTDAGLLREPSVVSALDEFKQLTRDIQDSVMAIRAQPVQPLFQRMSRIVREASQATEKKVKLVMEGEFTEVDKTIVEKLADPLTHMIRNAVDHGLETPQNRIDNGKPPEGTVCLSAAHRSGKIVIEVSDDGAGINREKVKSIAIKKGLITENADLTKSEIDNLLFMPGFSTVDQVSTLSGRGVGMDVVKRAIAAFGGRISITSEPGKGSTFTINLPLTLAVLDGMLVEVANQILVIPLTSIIETLQPKPTDIHHVSPTEKVINVRGVFLPLLDMCETLRFTKTSTAKENGIVLCVESEDGIQSALLVDAIQDQRQVVIKSLEDNYGHVPFVAAATILGDGRIALIADIDELVKAPSAVPPSLSSTPTPEAAYA
jgi:two-component system chemotaxis sensor kinase CheA